MECSNSLGNILIRLLWRETKKLILIFIEWAIIVTQLSLI